MPPNILYTGLESAPELVREYVTMNVSKMI